MITEQQVITQMKQVMGQIEQSTGETQKRHLAKLMGYCELLLADSTPVQPAAAPVAQPLESKPPLDRQMAAFLGIRLMTKINQKPIHCSTFKLCPVAQLFCEAFALTYIP
ncbi:DUF5327 family protein [Exiguobacterium mexicanum]|uniref:DUF5327 family protein n=1 Tax=Exiguobacterium mexicanum TaxID=340146 RepID=UPI0037BE2111